MRRMIGKILAVLLISVSVCAMAYPAFSDWWNEKRQDQLLATYETRVSEMSKDDYAAEWEKARAYNAKILENDVYGDVFAGDYGESLSSEYAGVLDVAGNGVMGYIEIPKISIRIAIYHGVGEDALERGAGHMSGTKLPIGGSGTLSVLAAHRGLPSSRLFTDIDQLGAGDVFQLHILDETLYYKVEKVWAMVDRYDTDTMRDAMAIVPDEDHVALFTCTPYGVNSHRMIVRGERFYPTGDEIMETVAPQGMLRAVSGQNTMGLIGTAAGVMAVTCAWALQGHFRKYRRYAKAARKSNIAGLTGGKDRIHENKA